MSDPEVHDLAAADLVVGKANFALNHDRFHRLWLDEAEEPPKRRPRRPTLARALREAAKVGAPVRSAEIEPGKITLTFGAVDPPGNALDEWLAKHDAH